MANLLKRHEFWLGMFIIALCLLLGWRSEEFFTSRGMPTWRAISALTRLPPCRINPA